MNREEVIALAQKFDMRKGRRPRVSASPRPAVTVMGTTPRGSGTGSSAGVGHAHSGNSNTTTMLTGSAPQNANVLSTRSEVEAAARLYDERLARASAYARKRRRDGKSTAKHSSSSSPPARSLAPRSSTQRAKKPHIAPPKPAPIVTSFPSAKVLPKNNSNSVGNPPVRSPQPAHSPKAGNNSRNSHSRMTSAVPVPAPTPQPSPDAGNTRIISVMPVPAPTPSPLPEAYSSTDINPAENASAVTFTPKSQDNSLGNDDENNHNPHHVITSASSTPLSTPHHGAQPAAASMNIVSSYTNTHQNEVMDLPAYPSFPEEPSASFDAPIYGPHPQSGQYQQQPQQQAGTIHYSQTHQAAQQQNPIEFVESMQPVGTSFKQEQQQADQILAYEQQEEPNAVGVYGNDEITPQSGSDAFGQSTVEYGHDGGQEGEQNTVPVHGHVNTFGQNAHSFGDAQTGVEGANPGYTDVTNGSSPVEAFQDNSFAEATNVNVVFEGPENVYEGGNDNNNIGTNGSRFGAGDPVAVEQTAQGEGYDSTQPNGVNGNGLIQEAASGDTVNTNTVSCYETVAPGPLFHEFPPHPSDPSGGFEGDGEYAHLIPQPPEPEEGGDHDMEWDTGTGTHTTTSTVFEEEDTLGELHVPAKKRRFNGMHIFGQEKRSKLFEQNE